MSAMTVTDLLRAATTAESGERRPELVAAAHGAAVAAVSWVVLSALVLGAVLTTGTVSFGSALGAGSSVWLALGGARLGLDGGTLALTPLLGAAALVLLTRAGARRALEPVEGGTGEGGWRGLRHDPPVRAAAAWLGGYAAVAMLAWALSALGPLHPRPLSMILPALGVPLLALALSQVLPTADLAARLPAGLWRGVAPGLQAAGALLAAGAVLLLVLVAVHHDRVIHVHDQLAPGVLGGLLLTATQVLALPNLALWAVSWMAGPGYSVSLGAQTTWTEAQSSLLPMIPALAASPEPGPLPWAARLAVLVPVLVGAWLARRTLSRLSRLASTRSKVSATAWAVLVAALAVTLLDWVGGGALGGDRLADVGAPALPLLGALVLELGAGALLVLARDWWRLRR